MRFRNSLRLLMENFKHVYKLLAARVIIGLVAAALCTAFVLPEVLRIWNSDAMQGLWSAVKAFTKHLATFTFEDGEMEILRQEVIASGRKVGDLLSSMTLEISLTILGCILVYLVKRFAETVCYFTTGSMLNDKMSSYAESGYASTLVVNLGKSSKYALAYVPLTFVYDVLTIALVFGLLTLLPLPLALFFGVTLILCLQAVKLTLTSAWMPAMTADNLSLRKATRCMEKAERKQRLKTFSLYLVSLYFIVIVNVIGALCTFGSALILTLPTSYFFLICMQYVNYYTIKGKKYFLSFEYIAESPDKGDSEHFFAYMEQPAESGEENENKKQ